MSIVTKELKAAWDRFRFWAWPISVRRFYLERPTDRVYRYPAPGSEPVEFEQREIDYKTAYRDSIHNVRYNNELHPLLNSSVFLSDPLGETVTEKLVRFGFLKKGEIKSEEAIAAAKKKYEAEIGESVDVKIHHDGFGIGEQVFLKKNPEAMGEFVNTIFDSVRQNNANEAWLNDLDEVYRAQFYFLKTFDMCSDDPVYRQLVYDFEGQLEDVAANRLKIKDYPVYKGDPSYWRILDDSFSEENIRKIQSSVKNYAGAKDFTPVHYSEGQVPPQRQNPTVPMPSKTQFVD